MELSLLSLPRMLWVHSFTLYLQPRDILRIRVLNRAYHAFINSLLSELSAALELQTQNLTNSVPEDIRIRGQQCEQLLEPARQCIQSVNLSGVTELMSFSNPPTVVKDILEVIICLYNEKNSNLTWAQIKTTIKDKNFLASLKEKFLSTEKHVIPPNPNYQAPWFDRDAARNTSMACASLVDMGKSYMLLQKEQDGSEELRLWMELKGKLQEVERVRRVYLRAVTGMTEQDRKKLHEKEPKKEAKKDGKKSGKKDGKKASHKK